MHGGALPTPFRVPPSPASLAGGHEAAVLENTAALNLNTEALVAGVFGGDGDDDPFGDDPYAGSPGSNEH